MTSSPSLTLSDYCKLRVTAEQLIYNGRNVLSPTLSILSNISLFFFKSREFPGCSTGGRQPNFSTHVKLRDCVWDGNDSFFITMVLMNLYSADWNQ